MWIARLFGLLSLLAVVGAVLADQPATRPTTSPVEGSAASPIDHGVSTPMKTGAAEQPSTRPSDELGSLRGTWIVEFSTGHPEDGAVFARMLGKEVVIDEGKLNLGDPWSEKLVRLGPEADPRHIDLIQVKGAKGWSRFGVCQIAGDSLRLSVNFPGRPRPIDFAASNDGREIVVLKRKRGV